MYVWMWKMEYLSGRGWFEGEDVSEGGDDVNGEADKERANGGVDGAKEWEYDGQEPYGDHHWQPHQCTLAQALALMHPYCFLPHKV